MLTPAMISLLAANTSNHETAKTEANQKKTELQTILVKAFNDEPVTAEEKAKIQDFVFAILDKVYS